MDISVATRLVMAQETLGGPHVEEYEEVYESTQEEIITSATQLRLTPGAFREMLENFKAQTGNLPQAIVVQNERVRMDVFSMMMTIDLPLDVQVVVDAAGDPDIVHFVATYTSDLEVIAIGPDDAIGQI